ncbi:MAG: TonB-dependent receptor [Myxococcales bacterium]|nr:TonB-dependent receptor [Myxococcales bacterium]
MQFRDLDPDQVHGAAEVSAFDANGFLEAPITDDLSVAVGFRGSYIDALIEGVVGDDSSVNVIAAPAYIDYQALVSYRPSRAHDLRLIFFGSNDELRLLFEDAQQASVQLTSGAVRSRNGFNRAILQYDFRPNQKVSNELQVALGVDEISAAAFDVFEFELNNLQIQGRNRTRYRFSDRFFLDVGIDGLFRISDISVVAPNPDQDPNNPDLDDLRFATLENDFDAQIAPYIEAEWRVTERLTLIPGIRLDYFSEAENVSIDPRIIGRYRISDPWLVKAGVGIFHQPPLPQELSEDFGNPDLDIQWSLQTSAGVEWTPTRYFKADITAFYKRLDRQVGPSNALRTNDDGDVVAAVFDNGQTGDVIGLEMFLRHDFNNNFRGWIAYTLSRSTRTDSGETEERLFGFDQTHILALVLSYVFPENWELSGRFRLVSGNPFTPITGGVYIDEQDDYAPISGDTNSERLSLFHQLDLRLDKRWVADYFTVSAFLEVLNLYNRANTEGLTYNFDFSERGEVQGLPIVPNVGVRVDF